MAENGRVLHRITCALHQREHGAFAGLLEEMKIGPVLMESGRCLRNLMIRRRFGVRRQTVRPAETGIHLYHFNVEPPLSERVLNMVAGNFGLDHPGRGSVYAREIMEFASVPGEIDLPGDEASAGPLRNLSLIKCILPHRVSGPDVSSLALEIGAGVPAVSLGHGTGMRDKLGLLRITISPDKEIIRLLVPSLDAEGITRLLVEGGRLNRPGKGFIYCCPIEYGFMDTRLRIGYQEHSASIGQIIAAIDTLKRDTSWRQRFTSTEGASSLRFQRGFSVITLVCPEEHSGLYIETAMENGALGATIARLQRLGFAESPGAAREECIFVVTSSKEERVIQALNRAGRGQPDPPEFLYSQPSSFIYSYRR